MQSLQYSWPLEFTLDTPGYTTLKYYSFVMLEGLVTNSANTPLIIPARVPMMVLRDPPGAETASMRMLASHVLINCSRLGAPSTQYLGY